jgi:hypothetical protein
MGDYADDSSLLAVVAEMKSTEALEGSDWPKTHGNTRLKRASACHRGHHQTNPPFRACLDSMGDRQSSRNRNYPPEQLAKVGGQGRQYQDRPNEIDSHLV